MSHVDLDEYLREDEPTLETVPASTGGVEAVEGTLAVTPDRVVFFADGRTTDVAVDDVTALQYDAPAFPLWNAVGGGVLVTVGALLLFVAFSGVGQPVTTIMGGLLTIVGAALLALGASGDRAATLEVYTPAQAFEFASTDTEALAAVPGAIRSEDGENRDEA
ncbi:hypothetical protein BRC81_07475 [Halobacteriales archaeon QS_1_68_20]|nr:MAG: hypothetical protein BRC81_07475 [Halobacteriales archaeon QS_1_68_20]